MLQLGDLAEIEHKKIGVELKKYNFEKVIGIGKLVKFITNDVYDSYTEAIPEVKNIYNLRLMSWLRAQDQLV